MNNILLLGFDFSLEKLGTPLTIIGIVLMVLSIFLVAGASKLDEALRAKSKRKNTTNVQEDGDAECDTESAAAESPKKDIMRDEEGNASLFKHSDGTFSYYMLFKIIGLVMVLASAIMIIVGMK